MRKSWCIGMGPQPAGRVVWLLRQACDSLEEAHDAGLVHRDIKGSNVFVCRLGKSATSSRCWTSDSSRIWPARPGPCSPANGRVEPRPSCRRKQVRGERRSTHGPISTGSAVSGYFLLTGSVVFNKPDALAMAVVAPHPNNPSRLRCARSCRFRNRSTAS
jgi:serine/threonine-protein kinase